MDVTGLTALEATDRAGAGGDSVKSAKARQAIEKFEGLFLSMMIRQMRETVSGEGLFPGDASDTLGGMFDMYLGDHLAQAGSTGMEQLLQLSASGGSLSTGRQEYAAEAAAQIRGLEEYRHEQLRAGALSALPAS